MSDWDNDRDDDDRDNRFDSGYGSHHTPSYSGSGTHSDFGKTSNFSTMISEDGRLFGIKLDPMLADRAKNVLPMLLAYLTDKGGDWATREFGPKYGNLVGYGIALSEQIVQTGLDTHKAAKSLNDLRVAVRPLSKVKNGPNNTSALSGDNEIVANARAKISGIYWQGLVETGVSTIGAFPGLVINYKKAKTKVHDYELNRKYEEAKGDPKKLAKILDEELTGGNHVLKGVNAQEMRAAMDEIIETRRAEYQKKFDAFESKHKPELKTDINAILKDLEANPNNANSSLSKLRQLGVNTEGLSEQIRSIRQSSYYDRDNSPSREEAIKTAVKEFAGYKDPNKKGRRSGRSDGSYIEDALRAKFVRQHGAFDQEWLEHLSREEQSQLRGNRDVPATEKERIEQQIRKMEDAHKKVEQEKESGKSETGDIKKIFDFGLQLGAGIVREIATKLVGGKALEKYKQPIALDRILNLRRTVEKAGENPPEIVPAISGSKDKDMGYVQYVHTVFQQHQEDSNRAKIGDRFIDHFEKARWDDAAIMEVPDDKLTAYEFAVKTIAQRIKTGRMDAIALVELVGDRQKKIVHNDGRSFGPHGAGKDEAAVKKAIQKIIDEKTVTLHAGQKQTDEQINENLGNFVFSVEDLKKALESKELDKHQRAFIFTLFSDVVGSDEKLCGKIGVTKERCQELRQEAKESVNSMMDGAVSVLADMIKNDPKTLEKHLKLTDKEKNLISSLAERAEEKGKNVADTTENREEIKSLETIVANTAMTLGREKAVGGEDGKQGFWGRLVTAAREKVENAGKRKAASEEATMPAMHEEENDAAEKANNFRGETEGNDEFAEKPADTWRDQVKSEGNGKSWRDARGGDGASASDGMYGKDEDASLGESNSKEGYTQRTRPNGTPASLIEHATRAKSPLIPLSKG